jgi:protease I
MAKVAKYQFDLEVCGGIYVHEPYDIDGNRISGRTWYDHAASAAPGCQARGDKS